MIELDQKSCRDLDTALSREWLETNGIGGFSSSTVLGLNTRRYHGLLTAATKPPVGRLVLLSKLEETLIIDERRYELSSNQYPGWLRRLLTHPVKGLENYEDLFAKLANPNGAIKVFCEVADQYE